MNKEAQLRAENEKLKSEIAALTIKNEQLSHTVNWYEEQIRLINIRKYQKTSEGDSGIYQNSLFDEAEFLQESIKEEENEEVTIKEHTRKKKTAPDYSKMELEVVHRDVENKKGLVELKSTYKEEIIYIPGRILRRKYIIHNYMDPKQSTDEHTVMVSGENYTKLINKSMASASLVAAIIYKKYVMGMPLYRIETDFNRKNIPITRQDMSNWLTICTDKYLKYLFEQMRQDLLKEDILYGDETTVNCLEEKDRDKSYMWIQRTSPTSDRQISLYYYNASREYGFAKEIYAGFKGYLHADAYGAYTKLDDVTVAACWAHARRYVFEALESYQIDKTFKRCHSRQERADLLAANKAYAKTLELFNLIEDLFKADKKITGSTKDYDVIKTRRLEEETLILQRIKEYLDENSSVFITKSKSNAAIQYMIGCWNNLQNYLKDGRLELTNNLGERTVKNFVVGRKNWLFANTASGAKTSAILYSLAETANNCHLRPDTYLTTVLDRMKEIDDPGNHPEEVRKLLPYSSEFQHNMHD